MSGEIETKPTPSAAGNLLVASPFVRTPPYRQTVVLLTRHDVRGAGGLVLENDLSILAQQLTERPSAGERFPRGREEAFPLRIVTGLVIWGPGALDREVEQGVWLVTPGMLRGSWRGSDLWSSLVRQVGADILRRTVGTRHFTGDSRLN